MTALKPLESHAVVAVSDHDEERKLLRRAVLNPACAHPECDDKNVEAHHLFPRSFISNSSWYVRIPGVEKPILHVAGLCREHHSDVEEHRAWVKLEDDTWNWYERGMCAPWGKSVRYDCPDYDPDLGGTDTQSCGGNCWVIKGPLDPQPGQTSGKKKTAGKKKGEARSYRAQWNVGVPKDERENGADVLDELELAVREKFSAEMGWSDTAPRYMIVVAALVKALQ